ncbi:MAG: IscS subfamily cysteine desulfurase [Acidobacteria bacterium]|nr:IscS subfamily cysteine desulfurase [Acidobacteriota bacterium]MBI3263601.1 IscS subfamily cysteine desulfurase [Acidobacteriota bacterium]
MPVYLDYNATTPVDPRVLDAMLPYFREHFGNAASRQHAFGWKAQEAVDGARARIAALIGADAREIAFTSGATESDNLALKGVARASRPKGDHIITLVTEHKAVLDSCRQLEAEGFHVTYLPVDRDGLVDPEDLRRAITPRTVLISVMAANNEIGVLQPLAAIGGMARDAGILFHTDAVQAAGKVRFDVDDLHVDLASITAHKMYGPKGVGALYIRRRSPRIPIEPLIDGGGQEQGVRSGTLNVAGIVGFGRAAEIAEAELEAEGARLAALRDRLWRQLSSTLGDIGLNGSPIARLPHTLNVGFGGVDGRALMLALDDVAVSSGAACTSMDAEPSHVLLGLGVPPDVARSSLRFSLGRFTTADEIDYAAGKVSAVVTHLRRQVPAFELEGSEAGPDL